MDDESIRLLSRLAPELMDKVYMRAIALERISIMQPVGRRALSKRLMLSEREARAITDDMRKDGLIEVTPMGMELTENAYRMIDSVRDLVSEKLGYTAMETQLTRLLKVGRVLIAPENADQSPDALISLGRLAANKLRQLISPGNIVAVAGGTTLKQMADEMPKSQIDNLLVLPARGGLGSMMETQASTVAEELAHKLGGKHKTLHIPDSLSHDALKELIKLKEIAEPLDDLKKTDILIYGIARVEDQAQNRLTPKAEVELLTRQGAVAEALGYCFDIDGHMIKAASGLGIAIDLVDKIPTVMAIAAGRKKAEAILAVTRHHKTDWLIIDAGAAEALIELLR